MEVREEVGGRECIKGGEGAMGISQGIGTGGSNGIQRVMWVMVTTHGSGKEV